EEEPKLKLVRVHLVDQTEINKPTLLGRSVAQEIAVAGERSGFEVVAADVRGGKRLIETKNDARIDFLGHADLAKRLNVIETSVANDQVRYSHGGPALQVLQQGAGRRQRAWVA